MKRWELKPRTTCIPADALLWALVARIRDVGYRATEPDLRGLLGSGCPRDRIRDMLVREAAAHPGRPFAHAIALLDGLSDEA